MALVAFREPAELVRRVVRERGYVAPVLLDESGDTTGRAYGVWGPPTVYLVNRSGKLVARGSGPIDWNSAGGRAVLESFIAER